MDKKALSQWEIDALLSSVSAEDSEKKGGQSFKLKKQIKSYDFKRPDKFSKDQIRTLQMLHETFARLLGSSLSAFLRMNIRINLVSVEQSTFDEYIHQITNHSLLGIVSMKPLVGNIILSVDSGLAFAIVDRLLGGRGKALQMVRIITDIEQTLVDRVLKYACDALAESWRNVTEVMPALEETALSTQFTKVALSTDVVITISFEVGLLDFAGRLSICIPYSVLEPVLPRLSAELWLSETKKVETSSHRPALVENLGKASVCVTTELGSVEVSVQELLQMQVGDVIPLNSWIGQDLNVWVEGRCKYRGQPGLVRSKIGVQITSVIEEEGDQIG